MEVSRAASCTWLMVPSAGALFAIPRAWIMQFSTLFQAFFRLVMLWNFKWILSTLHVFKCLLRTTELQSYKNTYVNTFPFTIISLMLFYVVELCRLLFFCVIHQRSSLSTIWDNSDYITRTISDVFWHM